MRGFYPFMLSAALAVTGFFLWARRQTRRKHARFRRQDVRDAFEQVLSANAFTRDTWELFLKWPIDDPYLESIRQRCRHVVADWPRTKVTEYIAKEGIDRLEEIYKELCNGRSQERDPASVDR